MSVPYILFHISIHFFFKYLCSRFEIYQQLTKSIEDMSDTILKSHVVRDHSDGAKTVFLRTEDIHSMVTPYVEHIRELKQILMEAVPDVIEKFKPIPTVESETQTIPVEFKDGFRLDPSSYKEPPMLSTRESQTTIDVRETSMQSSREFLTDVLSQTNPPPSQEDVITQTLSGFTKEQDSQAGENDPTVRISGGELIKPAKKQKKSTSCLSSSAVQEDVYAPTSITHISECTTQTTPDVLDTNSQTNPPPDMIAAFIQATPSIKEISAQATSDETERGVQTTPKLTTDGISQTYDETIFDKIKFSIFGDDNIKQTNGETKNEQTNGEHGMKKTDRSKSISFGLDGDTKNEQTNGDTKNEQTNGEHGTKKTEKSKSVSTPKLTTDGISHTYDETLFDKIKFSIFGDDKTNGETKNEQTNGEHGMKKTDRSKSISFELDTK